MANTMQVQFLSTAPFKGKNRLKMLVFALFSCVFCSPFFGFWVSFGSVLHPFIELFPLVQKVFVREVAVCIRQDAATMPDELVPRGRCYPVLVAPCIERRAEVVELMPGQGFFYRSAKHIEVGGVKHAVGGQERTEAVNNRDNFELDLCLVLVVPL